MTEMAVEKTSAVQIRPRSINVLLDNLFFVFGGLSAVWLAWIVLTESFSWGWLLILFFIIFWVVLAYLALPRLHRILTAIYVPNYFIGRARTSDGLLGDPINLALRGTESQLHEALRQAGWSRADDLNLRNGARTVRATIFRQSYDEAPVSPLFLFGRQQDAAYQQEVKGNPAKRHHVRFWRCPEGWLLPGGLNVDWLAAGTFDRSVGFSLFTLQVTHKIDANTDIERDHIVRSLQEGNASVAVEVIEDFSTGYHSRNGGGDTIETDGNLPIVDVQGVLTGPVKDRADEDAERAHAARLAQRPGPTTLGVLLMALRIVAGMISIAVPLLNWRAFIREGLPPGQSLTHFEYEAASIVGGVVFGVLGAAVAFYLVLAILVYRGSNWARIAAMSFSAFVVVVSAIDFAATGVEVSLRTNLLGLPLDILVVLALSSQRSRIWARRKNPTKRFLELEAAGLE